MCWVEGLREIVGLEVIAKSVRAGRPTHSESWWERVPDIRNRNCDAETNVNSLCHLIAPIFQR